MYIRYINFRRVICARFWFTFQSRFHLESSPVAFGSGFLEASGWEVRLWQKIHQISPMATPARIYRLHNHPANTDHKLCCFWFFWVTLTNLVLKRLISTWYGMDDNSCRTETPFIIQISLDTKNAYNLR